MKPNLLIFLTTGLFVILFYDQRLGLNLGIFGVALAILNWMKTPKENRTKSLAALSIVPILSSAAFAWYGDLSSFLAVIFSLSLAALRSKSKNLKSIFVVPIFAINFFTFFIRIFNLEQWLPKTNTHGIGQKMMAVFIIPLIFIAIFFGIYATGSNHFANIFQNIQFDFNIFQLLIIAALGFFISFNFWNFSIQRFLYKQNQFLANNFSERGKILQPTYGFLSLDAERLSGIVSLSCLNLMLCFFIVTYNYEQFVEIQKLPHQLSAEIHERVNAVIMSIVMAIILIMFYFKSGFNFDKKAGTLKILAKIWIVLNAFLVISAILKNAEYFSEYGATYKRLGVFAFLILSLMGLIFSFIKIQQRKTNAFLVNQMVWYFYGTVLLCSFVNWGAIATRYNINHQKGDLSLLHSFNFNDKVLEEKFPKAEEKYNYYEEEDRHFLSKVLYYETLHRN